ncbi:hypothetical protein yc1106_06512 [Curvularia clavata]|uniref:YDG domain-containing protein n=1 Tax=Curvularia clavata TaxID=95742 RepID=A0A9Q9DSZ8_CURCL|nr:hypothetical protein yc1106_06512 [Curvularia clavata]
MTESNQQNSMKQLWDAARSAVNLSGINRDEALASRLRDTRKQAEANSEQHQKQMRILSKRLSELEAKQLRNPASIPKQKDSSKDSTGTEKEVARATATPTPSAGPKVNPASEVKKRKVALMTRSPDKRQEKKVKARVEQTKQVAKETPAVKETVRQTQNTASSTTQETASATDKKGPKLQEKDTVRQPQKAASLTAKKDTVVISANDTERYTVLAKLPDWYTSISLDNLEMKKLAKKRPPSLTALDALKALVQQCESASSKKDLSNLFDQLRDAVHKAEITLTITPQILRKANMLSPQAGLPRIFQPSASVTFPPDLKADSYQLYKRWSSGDLKQSLLRGIVSKKSHLRNGDSIDPNYRAQFGQTFKYIGHGNLVQGQWWPTQLCAMRDGAHGAPQGGICGSSEQGAYSIVLSSGVGYDDTDDGDTIFYSGTSGSNGEATENTKYLLISLENGYPVRVLRSSQLPKGNPYRPQRGLRYDGLYTVVDVRLLDEEKAMHRFRLERCKGQMGIRYQGKGARPTAYEVKEYERLKEEGAWKVAGGS